MKREDSLLIFTRNLIYGKVKTRLAATIGNDQALRVYQSLVNHTFSVTKYIDAARIVCYSELIATDDVWSGDYLKTVQNGADLGERMSNAIKEVLEQGHKKVVIIGTDCYDLNETIITAAFEYLSEYDTVIGPALDGGYYLLGMKMNHHGLFENITWSTDTVFRETIARCKQLGLTYFLLPVLNDIDDEQDLMGTNILDKL